MTDVKVINSSNVTIQHSVYSVERNEAMGIALELIKTLATSGTPITSIKAALENLGEWTDLIHAEMKKNGD